MTGVVIVVPCYNEVARLDCREFLRWAGKDGIRFLFVDDGSTDGTVAKLRDLEEHARPFVSVLALSSNTGKGEAVRLGLRQALQGTTRVVGYLDADLATPVAEIQAMRKELQRRGAAVLIGSRVALLGHRIERHWYRHYSGRVFATLASVVLNLRVYDTQCGAKLFARSPLLESVLTDPFKTKWAFDVELLGRLLIGTPDHAPLPAEAIYEHPLHHWQDVQGSKLELTGKLATTVSLARVWLDLKRRKRLAMNGSVRFEHSAMSARASNPSN